MDSLTFLERAGRAKPQPLYVLTGEEDFLKRQVLAALRTVVFGKEAEEFGLSTHAGDKAVFATVRNELETLPFLSSRRLVVVEKADPFVTEYRAALEKYIGQPSATGVLVLDVKSLPANTRLAKLVDKAGVIDCKSPAAYKLPDWCVRWAAARHDKQLALPAASLLVDLVGTDMGQLDQELAKLAVYVGDTPRIDSADVDRLVGNSRAEKTFKIFDAMADGNPGEALAMLDRLFEQGEDPVRVLGAFSYQLRRLAQAARLCQNGRSLAAAFDQLEIPPFARQGLERQLRHLSRRRTEQLYPWLLEADLGLKGGSQLPPRTLLERLLVRLAAPLPKPGVGNA
jgi:DNA polymerase III subunit delta